MVSTILCRIYNRAARNGLKRIRKQRRMTNHVISFKRRYNVQGLMDDFNSNCRTRIYNRNLDGMRHKKVITYLCNNVDKKCLNTLHRFGKEWDTCSINSAAELDRKIAADTAKFGGLALEITHEAPTSTKYCTVPQDGKLGVAMRNTINTTDMEHPRHKFWFFKRRTKTFRAMVLLRAVNVIRRRMSEKRLLCDCWY